MATDLISPAITGLSYDRVAPERLVEQAVRLSRLTQERPQDIAYYVARAAIGPIVGDTFRKARPLMSKEDLRRHGLRASLVLGVAFFDTLNAAGRVDPVETASTIATTILWMTSSRRNQDRLADRFGAETMLRLLPSSMAAGPCEIVTKMAQETWPASHAPDLPISGCDKLGQCGCLYKLAFED